MKEIDEKMRIELQLLGFIVTTANIRMPYCRHAEAINIAVHRNLCPKGGIDIAKLSKQQILDNHIIEDVYEKCQKLGLIKK